MLHCKVLFGQMVSAQSIEVGVWYPILHHAGHVTFQRERRFPQRHKADHLNLSIQTERKTTAISQMLLFIIEWLQNVLLDRYGRRARSRGGMCGIKEDIICGISPRNMMTVRLTRPENPFDHNTSQEYPRGLSKIKHNTHKSCCSSWIISDRSHRFYLTSVIIRESNWRLQLHKLLNILLLNGETGFFNSLFFIVLVLSRFDKAVNIK